MLHSGSPGVRPGRRPGYHRGGARAHHESPLRRRR